MCAARDREDSQAGAQGSEELRTVTTYAPANHIVYVHMARESDPYATPVTSSPACTRLPVGYPNKSPRTHLRGCTLRPPAGRDHA